MKNKKLTLFLLGAMALLILSAILTALAASNSVGPSRLLQTTRTLNANVVKPAQCTMTIVNVVTGSGTITGTNQSDLILGSPGADTISGRGGADCILGGGGNDAINGNRGGGDVCIGGPGTDTFQGCETVIQDN
jgi:hypothetical protein